MQLWLDWILFRSSEGLFIFVLKMLEDLLLTEVLLNNLLWQYYMTQISYQISINAHLNHLSLRTQDID